MIPQAPSSYEIHETCQIENLGSIYEKVFGVQRRKRFVEVGAFDGKVYSNVWGLARAGWAGIMIEPMEENFLKCIEEHKDHPWIKVEPVACGEKEGMIRMFFEREGSRLAQTAEEMAGQRPIPVMTLDSILEKHGWQPDFELLVVDVEDYEREVLNGFTLAKWRPKLAIIETHAIIRPFAHVYFDQAYCTIYEDGLNTIFLRRDLAYNAFHSG